jgi:predicted amidohydrolase YtcJ
MRKLSQSGVALCLALFLVMWPAATRAEADWVLRGGPIYSMDASAQHYSAMALKGNRITWLGEAEAAGVHIGAHTQIVELDGRSVFPGFIDTHIHSMDTLPLVNGVKLSPYQQRRGGARIHRRACAHAPLSESGDWHPDFSHPPSA